METIFSENLKTEPDYFVFFDLDRTIARAVSGKALAEAAYRKKMMSFPDLLIALYMAVAFKLNLKDHHKLIDKMVSWVKGLPETTLIGLCSQVFREAILPSLNNEARSEIEEHKMKNARVVILSSALQPICNDVAAELGMDDVICSILEVKDGFLTGRSEGPLCFGKEKEIRLKAYCEKNNTRPSDAWYYGDACSDFRVLSAVGNPVCVNPDKKLKREAVRRGWKIVWWNS